LARRPEPAKSQRVGEEKTGFTQNSEARISKIWVHNLGWVFHKKLLAREAGCCIVFLPMPVFFLQNRAFAKNRHGAGPCHCAFFADKALQKSAAWDPIFN
jgi:hypothetical protein